MKFESWFQRSYILVILIFLGAYVLLSILAPIFMKLGWEKPAKYIYWIYSNFCHQYAYRSLFLFGEQAYYPLNSVRNPKIMTFSDAFDVNNLDLDIARTIIGNDETGYKVAICQRDLAIYGALFLFGILFLMMGRKLKKVPLLVWLLIGVLPVTLDGVIQLLGSYNLSLPLVGNWESTPVVRTVTGALFGIISGWLIYPSFESMLRLDRSSDISDITEHKN